MNSQPARWERRLGRVALAGLFAGGAFAACGGSEAETDEATVSTTSVTVADGATTTAAGGGAAAVDVRQFRFMPAEITVAAGTTVTWTNRDDILHTATSGATPGTPDGRFDGPMEGQGQSFSHTFAQPGRFPYFCSRHTSMTGTVVVQ